MIRIATAIAICQSLSANRYLHGVEQGRIGHAKSPSSGNMIYRPPAGIDFRQDVTFFLP
jgi:hypothetical protein